MGRNEMRLDLPLGPIEELDPAAPFAPLKGEEAKRLKKWMKALLGGLDVPCCDDRVAQLKAYVFKQRPWSRTSNECAAELLYLAGIELSKPVVKQCAFLVSPIRLDLRAFNNSLLSDVAEHKLGLLLGARSLMHWGRANKQSLFGITEASHTLRAYLEATSLISSLKGIQFTKHSSFGVIDCHRQSLREELVREMQVNPDDFSDSWKGWRKVLLQRRKTGCYSPLEPILKQAGKLREQYGWKLV